MPIRQYKFSVYEGDVDKDTLFPAFQDGQDVLVALIASDAVGGSVPVGSLIPTVLKEAPDGWLICDGRSVRQDEYRALFDVIGTTYGNGDEIGLTFNVPDFRSRTFWGAEIVDGEYNLNPENNRGMISAGLPDITGTVGNSCDNSMDPLSWKYAKGAFYKGKATSSIYEWMNRSSSASKLMFAASQSNPIYGNSTTVQPPAIAVNVLIKC